MKIFLTLFVIICTQLIFINSIFAATNGVYNKACTVWKNKNYTQNISSNDLSTLERTEVLLCTTAMKILQTDTSKLCLLANEYVLNHEFITSETLKARKLVERQYKNSSEKEIQNLTAVYLMGKINTLEMFGSNTTKVEIDALAQSFLNHSNNHPEEWNLPIGATSNFWISAKWPCKVQISK